MTYVEAPALPRPLAVSRGLEPVAAVTIALMP